MSEPDLTSREAMDAERERLENELLTPLDEALAAFIDALADAAAGTLEGGTVSTYAPPSFITAAGIRMPFSKDTARSLWAEKVTPAMTKAVEKVTGEDLTTAGYSDVASGLVKSILGAGNEAADKAYSVVAPKLLSSALLQRAAIARDLTRSLGEEGWAASVRREARHTATVMHNRKTLATMDKLGMKTKTWAAIHDDKTRPHHIEADGQTVPLSEPFILGEGLPIMFPGDPAAPMSETANCRCVIVASP